MIRLTLLILLAASLAFPGFAQLDRGAITGNITDATGAAIPAAKVLIRNTATGAAYEITANEAGQYVMRNLPAGQYEIEAGAPGMKKLIRRGLELAAAQTISADLTLEVGSLTESIQVTAEVPRLQGDTPAVGTNLSQSVLRDLPVIWGTARLAENFAFRLVPGVVGNTFRAYVNGSTAFGREALIDGVPANNGTSGNTAETSVSMEALSEFNVQTTVTSAEFGRTQGSVFMYVMRSGTNDWHGSLFGILRNEALNANSFSNNARGLARPTDRRWVYGGSLGGPFTIPKVYDGRNRTFFWFAYEKFTEKNMALGSPSATVPQPEWYDGDLSRLLGSATSYRDALGRTVYQGAIYDPASFYQLPSGRWVGEMFPGNQIPVSRISAVSRNLNEIMKKHYLPTVRDASGRFPLENNLALPITSTTTTDEYKWSVKMDQNISSRHKISGTYNYVYRPRLLVSAGGTRPLWDARDMRFGGPLSRAVPQNTLAQFARLAHDWTVSPRVLNHVSVYWNRFSFPYAMHNYKTNGAKELGIRNLDTPGYPNIDWSSGPFVALSTPGFTRNRFFARGSFGLRDTVSFFKGRHFMKAGYEAQFYQFNSSTTNDDHFIYFRPHATAIPGEPFSGNVTGYAFASYLLGIVNHMAIAPAQGLGGRLRYQAVYFQDDFKVSRTLTLNLGLRWDYIPPPMEAYDRLSSWSTDVRDPVSGLMGAYAFTGFCPECIGRRYFGSIDWKDFGPRFGFAWRAPAGLTVRGGYAILYDGNLYQNGHAVPLGKATQVQHGGNFALDAPAVDPWRGLFRWDDGFPADRFTPASYDVSWGNKNRPASFDSRVGLNPYIQQWNLNIQREVVRNLVLDIGYLANKATRLRNGQLAAVNQLPFSVLQQYGTTLSQSVRSPADAARYGIAFPFPGFSGTVASALRPYPQMQGNSTLNVYGAPLGFSTYHSLQVVVNRQFSRGLSVYANYVWSKAIANTETTEAAGNAVPMDYYNLALEKTVTSFDRTHNFKSHFLYELPFGRRSTLLTRLPGALDLLVSGWSVSGTLNGFTGTPLNFSAPSPYSFWNGGTNRANVGPGPYRNAAFDPAKFNLMAPNSPDNTYLNKAAFSQPPAMQLGNAPPYTSYIRGLGRWSEDLCLYKNHRIAEKYRFQLRAEFLNPFNRHYLGSPSTSINSTTFGQITSVSGERSIQIGFRLDF
jgi:hypothetical protein